MQKLFILIVEGSQKFSFSFFLIFLILIFLIFLIFSFSFLNFSKFSFFLQEGSNNFKLLDFVTLEFKPKILKNFMNLQIFTFNFSNVSFYYFCFPFSNEISEKTERFQGTCSGGGTF